VLELARHTGVPRRLAVEIDGRGGVGVDSERSRISGLLHQLRQVGADLTHLAVRAGRMNSVAPSWAALAATEVVVLVSGYQEQDYSLP
jgi:hypothetical protein